MPSPRAPSLFDNEPDERGNPICPVCRQTIHPGEAVARWRTFLVHVTCLRAARKREEKEPETATVGGRTDGNQFAMGRFLA